MMIIYWEDVCHQRIRITRHYSISHVFGKLSLPTNGATNGCTFIVNVKNIISF